MYISESLGKPNLQPWIEDINATLESSITTNEEHISTEPSGSSKKSQADQRMSAAKGKKPQPVYLSGKSMYAVQVYYCYRAPDKKGY